MTESRKVTTPAGLLALMPAMLGFIPEDSLVLLPMRDGRSIGAMRLDLPDNLEGTVETARAAAGLIAQTGVDGVIAAQFGLRNPDLHDWMLASFGAVGVSLVESMYVTDNGWGSFTSGLTGTLEEITPEELPGEPLGSNTIPPLPAPPAGLEHTTPSEIPEEWLCVLENLESYLTNDQPLAYVSLSVFMVLLSRPALRDIMLVQMAADEATGVRALDAQMAWEDGADYPTDLAAAMWGQTDHQPDPARLLRGLEIARTVLSVRPEPGAYATAAWLSWALGRSTHADQYAKLGLELEPEHGMCEIVASFVGAGHLPDWAFTRRATTS